MGITTSTIESAPHEDVTSSSCGDGGSTSKYGLSQDEVHHLLLLRRIVCCHNENRGFSSGPPSFSLLVARCSLLLSMSSSSSSSIGYPTSGSDTIIDIEQKLSFESKVLFQKEWVQLEKILESSLLLTKMDAAFNQLFHDNNEGCNDNAIHDKLFLENVAAIILGSQFQMYSDGGGQYQKSSPLDFVLSSTTSEEGSFIAKDVIELCFEMASLYHQLLIQDAIFDVDGEIIAESTIDDDAMLQSMTNSVLEYTQNYRDNQNFKYGADAPTASTSSAASSASSNAVGIVNRREFIDWQRQICPDLFQRSISSFLNVILFPPKYTKSLQRMHPLTPFPTILSPKGITSRPANLARQTNNGDDTVVERREMIIPLSSHVFGNNTHGCSNGNSGDSGRAPATTRLSPSLYAFTSISLSKFGECWYQIYDGETDGWTFQSMEHAILGYAGPTLFFIRGNDDNNNGTVTLGAYTSSNWEKNRKGQFFGNSDCFLFQLQPTLRVLKSLPKMGTRGGNYMYLHSTSNISNPSRKDDVALGIGFGGTARRPRLFIDSQLEECIVSAHDTSFEEGYLGLPPPSLSESPFSSQSTSSSFSTLRISSLEIYAVGDQQTISNGFQAQCQHRDIADATLRNARTVDKAAFLGDMRSGIIETKAFAHRGQVDGRANGFMKGEEK
jgi:hypothetical protein